MLHGRLTAALISGLLTGCYPVVPTLRLDDIATDEGALVGRLHVDDHGVDVTFECTAYFAYGDGTSIAKATLAPSGWVFTKLEVGAVSITGIACDGDHPVWRRVPGVSFRVAGNRTLAYFGDLTVELDSQKPEPPSQVPQTVASVDSHGITTYTTVTVDRAPPPDIGVSNCWLEDRMDEAQREFARHYSSADAHFQPLRLYRGFAAAAPTSSRRVR